MSADFSPSLFKFTRRHMLFAAGGALAAGTVAGRSRLLFSAGGEAVPAVSQLANQVKGYRRYYIVPQALDQFTEQRRLELDVLGPQLAALSCKNEQCRAPGFMAWLDPLSAGQVAAEQDVREVYELTPEDVQVVGNARDSSGLLTVILAPNGWSAGPKADTFLNAQDLAQQWKEQLKEFAATEVTGHQPQLPRNFPNKRVGMQAVPVSLQVQFENPEVPEKAIEFVRNHPQTTQMIWIGAIKNIQPGFGGDNCPGCGLG